MYIYKRGLEKSFLSPYAYFKYSFSSIMICRASCLAWTKLQLHLYFFQGRSTETRVRALLGLGGAPCRLGWQGPLHLLPQGYVLHKHKVRAPQGLHSQPGVDLRKNDRVWILSGLSHMRTAIWLVLVIMADGTETVFCLILLSSFIMCMDIFKNGMERFKCFHIVFIYALLKVLKWVN